MGPLALFLLLDMPRSWIDQEIHVSIKISMTKSTCLPELMFAVWILMSENILPTSYMQYLYIRNWKLLNIECKENFIILLSDDDCAIT